MTSRKKPGAKAKSVSKHPTASSGSSNLRSADPKRQFEFVHGTSDKFWEIERQGTSVIVSFGRRGTSGQTKTKYFPSDAAAALHVEKLVREKTDKGYREVKARSKPSASTGRGDPQAEYLYIQAELVRNWSYSNPWPELIDRLVILRPQLDPAWLATVRTCTTPPPPVNIAKFAPELIPLAKTTVRLNPRPGSAAPDASKIGGLFLWPKDEAWPRCKKHKSAFVTALQLRKEDFPEVKFQPGTDLMQLLWCPNDHKAGFCPDVQIFWRKRNAVTNPVDVHPDPTLEFKFFDYVPSPCLLYPERIIEYPDPYEDVPGGWQERFQDSPEFAAILETNRRPLSHPWCQVNAESFCDDALFTAWGAKLGGYPEWVQAPQYLKCKCGAVMDHLVSFSSGEFGSASWIRWLPIEERDILHADPELLKTVNGPTNCMFGDNGNMYVFICRKCPDWPTAAEMQCC